MAYKVETFGSWEGSIRVNEHFHEGDGRANFTVNTEDPPQVLAEVRRVDEKNPFQLVVGGEKDSPPVREV